MHYLNKSSHCAVLKDKGKAWLRYNEVKVVYMCHGTVIFRIHSTTTAKETENSMKTHGGGPLGGFCFLWMSPAHLGHWVSVSCQCQVESRNANGPLATFHPCPSPLLCLSLSALFPLLFMSEGGQAITSPLVVELCI